MKKLLFSLALMLLAICAMGQEMDVTFLWGRPSHAIKGGMEGKNYAAIIKTDLQKRDVVDKTTAFMIQYGMVDKDEIKLDEINESTAEFTVPMFFPLTQFKNGLAIEGPVIVKAEMRFEFHENGKVMIVAQNMQDILLGIYRSAQKSDSENMKNYNGETAMIGMTKSLIGKALIYAQTDAKQREEIYNAANKYFDDIVARVKVYNAMVDAQEAAWLNPQGVVAQYEQYPVTGSKYIVDFVKKCINENLVPGLGEKRWEKQCRVNFDELFKGVCFSLDGEIEGVAEDGNQTWALDNGVLLPTDEKQKKTYVKKQLSYYNQAQ